MSFQPLEDAETRPVCTFRTCDLEGTHILYPQHARPSRWCQEHGAAAASACQTFDNRTTEGSRLEPNPERLKFPRPRKAPGRY